MSAIGAAIIQILLCVADVYMFYIFIDSLFIRRVGKCRQQAGIVLLFLCLIVVNLAKSPWLNLIVIPTAFILFIISLFKVSVKRSILFTLIYYIIFAGNKEMAFEMLIRFFIISFPRMEAVLHADANILIIIVEYAFSLMLMQFIVKHTRRISLDKKSRGEWCLLISPIASIMILFSYVYDDFPKEHIIQLLVCVGGFLLYLANAIIFVILANYTATMNQMKNTEMAMLKKDLDAVHFQSIERTNLIYRKCMHDIHNYFYQIRNLAKEGEDGRIVSIIDDVEGKLKDEINGTIYINDPVINALLLEEERMATEQKIKVKVSVADGVYVDFIKDADKISMFGNLLNNAIEAVQKCNENNREINIDIYMANDYLLCFKTRNTWDQMPSKQKGKYLTTKQNQKNHGLGIQIIEELAQQYGGFLEITEEREWFIATLILSVSKKGHE